MPDYEKYLGKAVKYLSYSPRSEKEIRDYLAKKQAPQDIIDRIIVFLIEHRFLNDEEFARSWVSSRARSRPKGQHLLRIELQQKGIAKEIIEKILHEKNEEIPDELTQAKMLVEKRIEKLRGKPQSEIYNKIGGFLVRRGFGWETIKKALDEVNI